MVKAGSYRFIKNRRTNTDKDYLVYDPNQIEVYNHIKEDGVCYHTYNTIDGKLLLEWFNNENNDKMNLLSLIVPEWMEKIGLTIHDVKHLFMEYIWVTGRDWGVLVFEYYLQNNELKLTDEQYEIVESFYLDRRKKLFSHKKLAPMLLGRIPSVNEEPSEPSEPSKEDEIAELEAKLAALRG